MRGGGTDNTFVVIRTQTRQTICVKRNTEARSCNHMVHVVRVCVFVALGIQHEMPMRNIVICDLSGSTIFFYITS